MANTKTTTRFPSIRAVAAELRNIKLDLLGYSLKDLQDIEVRLQVLSDGDWQVRDGDPCYDQDHRGWWGAGLMERTTSCYELAKDLIDQAKTHHAMN